MDANKGVEAAKAASANAIGLPASGGDASRAGKAARAGLPLSAVRMMALTTAAGMLGQQHLADALGIEPRSLRAKMAAEHGVSDEDLLAAAAALDARAERIAVHAAKLWWEANQVKKGE